MSQLNLFEGIDNKEFIEYHKTNPHLYEAFKEIALKTKAMGFTHYGANGIFEIIRWKTAEKGDGVFKINNEEKNRSFMTQFLEKVEKISGMLVHNQVELFFKEKEV